MKPLPSLLPSIMFVSLLAVGAAPARAQDQPTTASLPVVVTAGQAMVTAQPDRAFITIAAESRARNSGDAQRMNAEAMTAVLQKIQQAGVPKEAIRTVAYELQPEFDYANGRQTFRQYVARNTVEVRLDNIDRVGTVIDAAGTGGATSIGGIRFDVKNREALEREALKQAVGDARARAEALADGAGRGIDRIIRIEEGGAPEPPRPMMRMAAMEQAASTPIVPSTIEIHARVTLTASLR